MKRDIIPEKRFYDKSWGKGTIKNILEVKMMKKIIKRVAVALLPIILKGAKEYISNKMHDKKMAKR
ncbi:hypothetical protein [Bacillus testis]|uniref:hypothetical protein n=1 Tax=Bacillus testis TaxID=1622072 RepID=UPI00067E9740|nr:hypothetical protein [Bacillus testis]